MNRRHLPILLAFAFAMIMLSAFAILISAFTRGRHAGRVAAPTASTPAPAAWHPGEPYLHAAGTALQPTIPMPRVLPLVRVDRGAAAAPADVGEDDPTVAAALREGQRLTADLQRAQIDAYAAVAPDRARALLDADERARDRLRDAEALPIAELRARVEAARAGAQTEQDQIADPDQQDRIRQHIMDALRDPGDE